MRAGKKLTAERKHKGVSIKWKLLIYLALFTAFVLLVVWVFQVLLLDRFYERTKLAELHMAASELSECITDEKELKTKAEAVLGESMIFSKMYRVEDDKAILIMSQDFVGNYFLKHATASEKSELFNKAQDNGGIYVERRTVEIVSENYSKNSTDSTPETPSEPHVSELPKEIIYVQLVEADSETYIIMLNMIYTPLDSTVRTLNTQFVWIAAVLLLGAVVLSTLMSYKFSTPLVRMNDSAKELAKGKYDADFSGEGFREARELADTLNYASEELSKLDNLQKDLIANISHDLRTPLTMITGYSEVMRDIPGENTPENIQVIIDESTHLTELVNDLLDLSKIQAGTVVFEKEVFNLTEMVRSAMQRYSKLISYDGFRIEFFADSDIYIEADRTRMLQVVYNLINNAVNYSGDDKLVQVRQTVTGNRVRISVSDNGEGIAPDKIQQIWDRYYKVDRVHKRAVVGTGLGLSIVKGILEAHGATYGVESALGCGSTFWFEMLIKQP